MKISRNHEVMLQRLPMSPSFVVIVGMTLGMLILSSTVRADDKSTSLRNDPAARTNASSSGAFQRPKSSGRTGHRIQVGEGEASIPLVVVTGTPYEMGKQLGELMGESIRMFVPKAMAGI